MPKLNPNQLKGVKFLDDSSGGKLSPDQLKGVRFLDEPSAAPVAAPAAPVAAPTQADPPRVSGERPSKLESFLRGAKQGISLGFGDEVTGLVESAFTDKTYEQARDESRAADKAAQEANPWSFGAGSVGGGAATMLIPGLNVAKGATVGAAAGKAALTGAISGLGSSDADVQKGEGARLLTDTVLGAGIGALTGAASAKLAKAIGGAPEGAKKVGLERLRQAQEVGDDAFAAAARKQGPVVAATADDAVKAARDATVAQKESLKAVTDDAMDALRKSAKNSTKTRAFGVMGKREDAIREQLEKSRDLRAALIADDGKRAFAAADDLAQPKYKLLEDIYEKAQSATPGAKITDVRLGLHKLEKKLAARSATKGLAKTVAKINDDFAELHKETNVVKQIARVPLQTLREEYRLWQDRAFQAARDASGRVSPKDKVAEDISNILKDVLHKEIDRVATRNPSLGISRDLLQATNREVSALEGIKKILTEKVTNTSAGNKTMGQMTEPLIGIKALLQEMNQSLREGVRRNVAVGARRLQTVGDGKVDQAIRKGYAAYTAGAPARNAARVSYKDRNASAMEGGGAEARYAELAKLAQEGADGTKIRSRAVELGFDADVADFLAEHYPSRYGGGR